jgi:CheY-like chemotaxis protein
MPRKPSAPREPDAAPLAGARVLVVDDHAVTIGLVREVVYASGAASVHAARNGGEAMAMLGACHPHLVVTDWRMPGMDGLAFTRAVRRAAARPDPRVPDADVPIVLLSAYASAKAVDAARRAGVDEVVVKPFAMRALLERLVAATSRPRPFVVCEAYVGPDRRRRKAPNAGRRASDQIALIGPSDMSAADDSILRRLQTELGVIEREARRSTARTAPRAQ